MAVSELSHAVFLFSLLHCGTGVEANIYRVIPQFPEFKLLEWTDQKDIEQFTARFPPYSDFNFTSMYTWDVHGKMKVSQLYNNLVVLFTDYITGQPFLSFLGRNTISETAGILIEHSEKSGYMPALKLIPETVVQDLSDKEYNITPDRDAFDYVYAIEDLHKLHTLPSAYEPGRKVRQFINHYPCYSHVCRPLQDIDRAKLIAVYKNWANAKGICCTETNEYQAFDRLLANPHPAHFATLICVDNIIRGFLFSEVLSNDFAVCHFGKADVSFKSIYDVLLWHTGIMLHGKGITHLNFEQDLGLENLRHAKEKHRRHTFLKKYIIEKKSNYERL